MLDALLHNATFVLFAVITLGLVVGQAQVAGLSLGASGILFVALALGHLGARIPDGVGTVGLVLFVYGIGLNAGPGFFRIFASEGKSLALLGAVVVAVGVITTWTLAVAIGLPADLAAGMFGGALTSTPALAAAMQALPAGSQAAVVYGITYPFGVISVVLFIQFLPRLLRQDLSALSAALQEPQDSARRIVRALVEVLNPAVLGKTLSDLDFIAGAHFWIPRCLQGNRLVPVSADFTFQAGQHVLVVGQESRLPGIITLLGRRSDKTDYSIDLENERMQVVVSSPRVVGHTLRELRPLSNFGVTVSRITRHGMEFAPTPTDAFEFGDALNVVGEPAHLERFAAFAGHRAKTVDETDLISLGTGMVAGIALGMVAFDLGGSHFSLGMAGGPLFVALILGHFGRLGRVVGYVPRAAQLLMTEAGLAFFLADAGAKAGGTLLPVLQEHGLTLALAAIGVSLFPLVVGYLVGRFLLDMNLLQLLGALCGGMTSTPALGVLTSKTDSNLSMVSYTAAYPVSLILMTVGAQTLFKR